ncbi:MAG: fumarate hydratase [Thiotrichales bacterium]|nr:MAG: fumarate hydratase [Thiotrichales bacterium]
MQNHTTIKQSDFIKSVEDALQFISYYHPKDFITAMHDAYKKEESPAAKDAMAQILVNARMAAEGKRPMCQDTGIVCVFVKIGMQVIWDGELTVQQMVDEGVRKAYTNSDNPLRASIVNNPLGKRENTRDNTPAVVHIETIKGNKVHVSLAAKGGGSEFKAKFAMLNPSDSLVDWILKVVPTMGAGWCPPGILGIGVGGSSEKALLLAKESLNETINIQELLQNGAKNRIEELRLEIYKKVNDLGIGAQGLGGLTTVLDIKIKDYPTHVACLPVAVIPNCASTRHTHFTLDGSGTYKFTPPDLNDWPKVALGDKAASTQINADTVTKEELSKLKTGATVLLSGEILTGRDAAHKRMFDMWQRGEELPVSLKGRMLYYVGPVKAVRDEVIGPAGPTTATRMDKFTDFILDQGVIGMIGKAERGTQAIDSIKKHKSIYMMAVGGAAYLIAKAITSAKLLAFEDLGTEAIYEFTVKDMPVTVAVDSLGNSAHTIGPNIWRNKIAGIQVIQK